MLEQHQKKQNEFSEWSAVVGSAISQKDSAAKEAVLAFQKLKKHVVRSATVLVCTISHRATPLPRKLR